MPLLDPDHIGPHVQFRDAYAKGVTSRASENRDQIGNDYRHGGDEVFPI
jgi:hypothetical protein